MKKECLLISLMFVLVSCAQHKSANSQEETIHLENVGFTDWLSVLQMKRVIPLKGNPDSLLTVARKILVNDKHILFWDYKLKCVYAYDRQGNFLYDIGRQGEADFECADLRDVAFSGPDDSHVELLDATGILTFDAQNGTFLGKKKLNGIQVADFNKFAPLSDDSYLFFDNVGDYTIYVWKDGQLKGIRKHTGTQLIVDFFYATDGMPCLVLPNYGQFTIDEFRDGTLVPKYHLDFGSKALPESDLPKTSQQFTQVDRREEYFKCVTDVQENEHLLYAKVRGPAQYYDVIKEKKDGRVWIGSADISSGMDIIGIHDQYLCAVVYPEYISEDSSLYPYIKKHFAKKEDAYPVLIEFSINEQ